MNGPIGVLVEKLDWRLEVSKFEFHSGYYVDFRTYTPGERYEPSYPPSYELTSSSTLLLTGELWY